MSEKNPASAKQEKPDSRQSAKPRKKHHRVRWTILTVLVVLILLVAFAPTIISTPWGRDLIAGIATDALHRKVTIDKLELGWFSGVNIEGLNVANRDGESGYLVKADRISAVIHWWPLLAQQLRLSNARIEGLDCPIVCHADGTTNIDDLTGGRPSPAPGAAPAAQGTASIAAAAAGGPAASADAGGLKWITNGYIDALLDNCRITYKDEQAGAEVVIDKIHVPVTVSSEVAISDASMTVNGGPVKLERIVYGLTGGAAPIDVKMTATGMEGAFALHGAPPPPFLRPLVRIFQVLPLLHPEGTSSAAGKIQQLDVDIKGQAGSDVPEGFQIDGTVLMDGTIGKLDVNTGAARLLVKLLGWDSIDAAKIATGEIQIDPDGRIVITRQITITCAQADIVITGSSTIGGELDYRLVLNPKVDIPGDKKDRLAKVNALLTTGVLAFKIVGTEAEPKVLPDPEGGAHNVFVSIFGKPTNNPFVRDGSVVQRFVDLLPRPPSLPGLPPLPGLGPGPDTRPAETPAQPESRPAGPPNPLDLFRELPKPPNPFGGGS